MSHRNRFRYSRFSTVFAGAVVLVMWNPFSLTASETIAADSFERASGALGSAWTSMRGGAAPTIVDGRACADVQRAALFGAPLTTARVRVSYSFTASDPSGFESYVVAGPTCSNSPTVCEVDADCGAEGVCQPPFIVGCSGGWYGSGWCLPRISHASGEGPVLGRTGTPIPMQINRTYRVTAEFEDGLIQLEIADADGVVLGELESSTHLQFSHFGLLVGRNQDSHLTCADEFRIEALSPRR